jgi:hypothetical protein
MDVFVLFTSGLGARFLNDHSSDALFCLLYNERLERNALTLPLNFESRLIKRENSKGFLARRPAEGILCMNNIVKIPHPIPCIQPPVKL